MDEMFSSEIYHNFQTARKQKDIACRSWVLNPRPNWNYQIDALPTELHDRADGFKTGNYELYTECHKHTRLYQFSIELINSTSIVRC